MDQKTIKKNRFSVCLKKKITNKKIREHKLNQNRIGLIKIKENEIEKVNFFKISKI